MSIDVNTANRGWNVVVTATRAGTTRIIYSAYIVNPAYITMFATTADVGTNEV